MDQIHNTTDAELREVLLTTINTLSELIDAGSDQVTSVIIRLRSLVHQALPEYSNAYKYIITHGSNERPSYIVNEVKKEEVYNSKVAALGGYIEMLESKIRKLDQVGELEPVKYEADSIKAYLGELKKNAEAELRRLP